MFLMSSNDTVTAFFAVDFVMDLLTSLRDYFLVDDLKGVLLLEVGWVLVGVLVGVDIGIR